MNPTPLRQPPSAMVPSTVEMRRHPSLVEAIGVETASAETPSRATRLVGPPRAAPRTADPLFLAAQLVGRRRREQPVKGKRAPDRPAPTARRPPPKSGS